MHRKLILSIAAFLIAAFLSLPLARAENAFPCVGRDLIAEMKAKDPAGYEKLVAEASSLVNGDSAFWRIDGPAGTQPSWLLGTIHLSDPRVVELDPKMAEALDKASTVAIETRNTLTPEEAERSTWQTARYLVLPTGTSLYDLLGAGDAKLLREKLTAIGFDPDTFAPYQPWVVSDYVIYPACERARSRAGFEYLDLSIAYRALSHDIAVIGLEDPVAQAALFASIPMSDQVAYLASALRLTQSMEDDVETAVVNWRNGQLAMLYAFSDGFDQLTPEEIAAAKRAETYFLDKRNLIMRDAARPLLDKGNAFIAVGGYHLLGENGLVELLRKAGYKVTPVK
jgi:hypothetical protein